MLKRNRDCTPTIFKQVQELSGLKMTNAQISRVLGYSLTSISRCLKCKSWDELVAMKNEYAEKQLSRYKKLHPKKGVEGVVIKTNSDSILKYDNPNSDSTIVTVLRDVVVELRLLRQAWESHPKSDSKNLWPFKTS